MEMFMKVFGLKREAVLLDSWLYIVKAMLAISAGYVIGNAFPLTRLDMISVLLGVMYTLEPVNAIGIRSGINQLLAASLGALVTGFLIFLMGYQVSVLTVALGMGFTMYIALKIDYRLVSPVAIFTSIYMNQFLQSDAMGSPSIFLTFRLRFVALGLGVLIAILFNTLFSFLYYRKIGAKRMEFVRLQSLSGLKRTRELLIAEEISSDKLAILSGVFNDIEMVKQNLENMLREKLFLKPKELAQLKKLDDMVIALKNIIHLAYDCIYLKEEHALKLEPEDIAKLDRLIGGIESLNLLKPSQIETLPIKSSPTVESSALSIPMARIKSDLDLMGEQYQRMTDIAKTL